MTRLTASLATVGLLCVGALGALAHRAANGPDTLAVYLLDTCPVSGAELGSMGDPVIRTFEDREVRFCCAGCIGAFEEDTASHFEKIDAALVEQQKPFYPLDACPVSGRSLDDADNPQDIIHKERLVRFCCPGCPPRFKADPDRYLPRVDEAIIASQRDAYPLDECVVAGMKLGSMGEPFEIIAGNVLVRFCCAGCVDGFSKSPTTHLQSLRPGAERAD